MSPDVRRSFSNLSRLETRVFCDQRWLTPTRQTRTGARAALFQRSVLLISSQLDLRLTLFICNAGSASNDLLNFKISRRDWFQRLFWTVWKGKQALLQVSPDWITYLPTP